MARLSCVIFIGLTLTLLSLGAASTTSSTQPTTQPAAVKTAQSALETWVGHFRGMTEKQVLGELGDPGVRETWQSGDQHGLKLRYPFGPSARLDLLFSGERVVYADFTVTSS